MNNQNKNLNLLWLALYAALILFATGRWQIPLVAWIAPVFAIRFYRHHENKKSAFFWLWLSSVIPTIIAWHNATAMHFMGGFIEPIFFTIVGLLNLIPFILDRRYHLRWASEGNSPFWLTLIYPISVTAMDFFSASGSPFGSFGAAAYSQSGFTALMQISSVVGLWGIPFIVGWFGSTVNYLWENDFRWTKIRIGTWIYAGLLILIFSFSFGRILFAPAPKQDVMIGGFSLPEGEFSSIMQLSQKGDEDAFRVAATDLNTRQLRHVRELAQSGAQIVSLQEGAGIGFPEEIEILLEDAAKLAQEENIYLVLPTVTIDSAGEEPFHNVVRIINPNGDIVLEHYKYGGTQFEGSVTGSGEIQTVDTPYGKLSAVICWDADFPSTIKQAGAKGVDLLFVPSNDWFEVRDIHNGMATFRAIENGMSIYRQTGAGVSSVVDAYGREINRVDIFEDENTGAWSGEQIVITPIGSIETLFPKIGDAFGQVMLFGLLGLFGFAWLKRK